MGTVIELIAVMLAFAICFWLTSEVWRLAAQGANGFGSGEECFKYE